MLDVPRTEHVTIGGRAFSSTAACVWNSLPTAVQSSESLDIFRRRLKTELFERSYNWHRACQTTLLLRDSLSLSRNFMLWPQPWSLSTIMLLWHSFLIIIIIIITVFDKALSALRVDAKKTSLCWRTTHSDYSRYIKTTTTELSETALKVPTSNQPQDRHTTIYRYQHLHVTKSVANYVLLRVYYQLYVFHASFPLRPTGTTCLSIDLQVFTQIYVQIHDWSVAIISVN